MAQQMGIGMVHQELTLVPALTVAENILINRLPRTRFGMIDWPRAYELANEALQQLGVDIDPRRKARELTVSEQQLTEIARVLSLDCRILLLDEPTSALSETETERLFEVIRRLQADGVGIIYISHRLHEIALIGDRVTVLRDGQLAGTMSAEDADRDTVVSMMIGRSLKDLYPKVVAETGECLLAVENLSVEKRLQDISFELRQGEVLGVFGLMGAGQTVLAQALFGMLPLSGGQIQIDGQPVSIRHPNDAIQHKMAYVTSDRRQSLVRVQPMPPNIALANTSQMGLMQRLKHKEERRLSQQYVEELDIRPRLIDRPMGQFSGGNQQKVVLARWMSTGANIIILDEPTRGIDVGAKAEVFALINRLTQAGTGIIMISSEISEILGMSDRIFVLRDGRIVSWYLRGEATQEQLLHDAS
jgi:ribose transport system ATP-binding protein